MRGEINKILTERLQLIFEWYKGIIDEETGRFVYIYHSQYSHLLFDHTKNGELKKAIKDYVFELQDRIIQGHFYKNVEKYPRQQSSVEVACALEGLNDPYSLAYHENDDRTDTYYDCICGALSYLLEVQCIHHCAEKQRGGFGFLLTDRIQRIDVTGHVVSAFIKSLKNKIVC